jgi:hypothetical protein
MDWHNFSLGFFLWLTSSGLLLNFFKKSKDSRFRSQVNNPTNTDDNNNNLMSTRIEELEKQLDAKTNALNLANLKIQDLEKKVDLNNQKIAKSQQEYPISQQKLQEKTIELQRQIEILQEQLKTSNQEKEESEKKFDLIQQKWQERKSIFQAQVEALQEELQITSDQLELTQNKYFNSQQDFEQQATNYQDKIEQLELKNKKLTAKIEQLPKTLQGNWQQESIDLLQELLISYPTAKLMVELKHNLPSKNILALLKPLEQLLEKWDVETIGQPWKKVPYNPNIHDCGEENISEGELVYIRWVGYYQGDNILLPAKVSRKLPGQK